MKIINYWKYPNCPKEIDDVHLDEEWALRKHGQTLARLNERGGLSPIEIFVNINKTPKFSEANDFFENSEEKASVWLQEYLKLYELMKDC